MSQVLINQYLAQLDVLKKVGGTHGESVVREAFKDLLKGWGKQHDLVFHPRVQAGERHQRHSASSTARCCTNCAFPSVTGRPRMKPMISTTRSRRKFKRGYPQDNIIFEDGAQAVLIQRRAEVMRCGVTDVERNSKSC